jgi:hypothetical protein
MAKSPAQLDAEIAEVLKKPKKWAYHATTGYLVEQIAGAGLHPSAHSVKLSGTPVLFFTEDAANAYRYFIDREDAFLLRFPWPRDARQEDRDEWVSRLSVPPQVIYVYMGHALDRLLDAYHLDVEARFAVLDSLPAALSEKVEHARTWAPLAKMPWRER